jgi:hypothetical protein
VQCFDAIRHPQTVSIDSVDGAPVDRCGTCTQRLIQGVAETYMFDERQAFRKNETDLEAGFTIPGGRKARMRAPRRVCVYLRATSLDTASYEQAGEVLHYVI